MKRSRPSPPPSVHDVTRRTGRVISPITSAAGEEFFQDERTYVNAGGACGAAPVAAAPPDAFVITCSATAAAFTYTATGRAAKGMSAFTYSIDEAGARATVSVPAGWSRTADCWTIRADGSCV